MNELENTFIEEYQGALEQMEKGRYKNATILFSKALFALCDLTIMGKLNRLPKNHTERFRILDEYFPNIYSIVDDVFNHYTDAYSKPVLKEACISIKNGIKKIIGFNELPDSIKKIIK